MTQSSNLTTHPIHPVSLGKRILQGAGLGLFLILFILLAAGAPDPDWPKLWMIRPLIMVPLAGALGGVYYYSMDQLRYQGGWRKILATTLSLIGYLIVLWFGTVMGLDGTWWD